MQDWNSVQSLLSADSTNDSRPQTRYAIDVAVIESKTVESSLRMTWLQASNDIDTLSAISHLQCNLVRQALILAGLSQAKNCRQDYHPKPQSNQRQGIAKRPLRVARSQYEIFSSTEHLELSRSAACRKSLLNTVRSATKRQTFSTMLLERLVQIGERGQRLSQQSD
jgi:hypothetical protein